MRRRLNFRCKQCRTITMTTAEWKDATAAVVTCTTCGRSVSLSPDRDRGATDQEYRELVQSVATTYGIDVSTANSLFESIMTFEEASMFQRRSMAFDEERAAKRGRSSYIVAGTVAVVLVAIIFVSLPDGEKPVSTGSKLVFEKPAAVAASIPDAAPDELTPRPTVVYWTDDSGLLSEVSGSDPRSVLEGFCAHAQNADVLVPVEIRSATPPNPGVRVGVLRDLSRPGYKMTVLVRRDLRTGRWYVGDRHGTIQLEEAGYDPTEDGRQR